MASIETIEKLKNDLRIKHTVLDADINDNVDACLADLAVTAGVCDPDETDPLILAAVKMYVRANYTSDTKEAGDYMARYEAQKAALSMAGGYGGANV